MEWSEGAGVPVENKEGHEFLNTRALTSAAAPSRSCKTWPVGLLGLQARPPRGDLGQCCHSIRR